MSSTDKKHGSAKGGSSDTGAKRKQPSSSSVSDSSPIFGSKQSKKKAKQDCDSFVADMDLSETLLEIKEMMFTKQDFEMFKSEVFKLTKALSNRVDILETTVFDLQTKNDSLVAELNKLKGDYKEVRGELKQKEKEIVNVKRAVNDNEQHGRQWNVRVFGVEEKQGETAEDCIEKCVKLFTDKLGINSVSSADVDIAHRSGTRGQNGQNGKPRPILLRFISRRKRGLVLAARRKLKGTGLVISEDLTQANHRLLKQASEHSATMSAWSSNGKLLVKLKNGKIVKIDVDIDLDTQLRKEMN